MAPIVVFIDSGGSFNNDTECVNGPRGQSADHLTLDVRPYLIDRFGAAADPAIARFLHELFSATPAAGRGAWARVLVEEMGPKAYIDLSGLTVPALVIGSTKDRLLPMSRARKIAEDAPNLIELVEMPGGHCAPLEHPAMVNQYLRGLAAEVASAQRISS